MENFSRDQQFILGTREIIPPKDPRVFHMTIWTGKMGFVPNNSSSMPYEYSDYVYDCIGRLYNIGLIYQVTDQ